MKVIATKLGYYGRLREPGDEFDVPSDAKASWFEPVETQQEAGKGKKPAAKPQPDDLV